MREKSSNKEFDLGTTPDSDTRVVVGSGLLAHLQGIEEGSKAKGLVVDSGAVDPKVTADAMFDLIRIVINKSRDGDSKGVVQEVAGMIHELRVQAYSQGYKDGRESL